MCNKILVKEDQGKFLAIGTVVIALVIIVSVFVVFIFIKNDPEPYEHRNPRRRRPDSRWGISMEISDEWSRSG
jgi:hypothetical protein